MEINNNNYEHAIVFEIEMIIDQYYNNNFLANENEDEEENKVFGDEYEEFEEEKKKNIGISFSDYLEYDFHESDES